MFTISTRFIYEPKNHPQNIRFLIESILDVDIDTLGAIETFFTCRVYEVDDSSNYVTLTSTVVKNKRDAFNRITNAIEYYKDKDEQELFGEALQDEDVQLAKLIIEDINSLYDVLFEFHNDVNI